MANNIEKDIKAVAEKLKQLQALHQERLKVKFVDEDDKIEQEIDALTHAITGLLKKSQQGLKRIAVAGNTATLSQEEKAVRLNLMRHLGTQLQAQSKAFKSAQKKFLQDLRRQQDVGKEWGLLDEPDSKVAMALEDAADRGMTQGELQQFEELKTIQDERYREIVKIAESIHELAQLFNELNVLVIEQGTILDRIDYNIEQALTQVKAGTVQLVEADKISRKARSLKCILCLSFVVIVMLTILILKHTSGSDTNSNP
jgi:syntaxin 16